MRGCAGVEEPFSGLRTGRWNIGHGHHGEESLVILDILGGRSWWGSDVMHILTTLTGEVLMLGCSAKTRTKHASTSCTEWHRPGLDHASPWVEAWCPASGSMRSRGATTVVLVGATSTSTSMTLPIIVARWGGRGNRRGPSWRISTEAGIAIGGWRKWSMGDTSGDEGMLRGNLVMLLVIVFLKKKVRSRREEGVWWLFGDDG